MKSHIHSAQIILPCRDIDRALEFFTGQLGFRLEMILPADDPRTAVVSGYGTFLRLEYAPEDQSSPPAICLVGDFASLSRETPREIFSPDGVRVILKDANSSMEIPEGRPEFVLTTLDGADSWHTGRAGMQYRDLIPNRLGGRFIASHIRIEKGGEVPDYVHFHKIRFQMIFCLSGWARLVYEDQGAPFLMKAGDCVLQPPEIRHRVLECSDKFEVLEIGCPAVHETFADHQLDLPNKTVNRERIFGGQKFLHHIAENGIWKDSEFAGIEERDTGISEATDGLAETSIWRANSDTKFSVKHSGEFLFFFVLKGNLNLQIGAGKGNIYHLKKGSSFVLPADAEYLIEAEKGSEMLRVGL